MKIWIAVNEKHNDESLSSLQSEMFACILQSHSDGESGEKLRNSSQVRSIRILIFPDFFFQLCGVVVLMTGFYLFTDKKRMLLSSLVVVNPDEANPLRDLKFPLFLYVAFILTVLGMLIVSISFVGYWTALLNNCCLLSTYFVMVLFLLLIKFALCIVITIWPQSLGLNLNVTEMVKILQGSYGVPGLEQYTVALDFAQTFLDCCAINDSINYDTSLWRLQKFGKKELTVPLTCCTLMNKFEENSCENHVNVTVAAFLKFQSFTDLDPIAINETMCQSLEMQDFQKSRHVVVSFVVLVLHIFMIFRLSGLYWEDRVLVSGALHHPPLLGFSPRSGRILHPSVHRFELHENQAGKDWRQNSNENVQPRGPHKQQNQLIPKKHGQREHLPGGLHLGDARD